MKDETIADLVFTVADDMGSAALNSHEALEFVLQIGGWRQEDVKDWMEQNGVCGACIGNFEDNNSLYSPLDCSCEE